MKTKRKNNKNKGKYPIRCIISGKIISNNKEAVLTKFVPLWIKKNGMRIVNSILLITLWVLFLGLVSAELNINDDTIPHFQEEQQDITVIQNLFNMTFNETIADNLYWRLDNANSPPSASWNMGSNSLLGISELQFTDAGTPTIDGQPNGLIIDTRDLFLLSDNAIVGTGGTANVPFNFAGSLGSGRMRYLSTNDIFEFQSDLHVRNNVTLIGNLSVDENIIVDNFLSSTDGRIHIEDFHNISWRDDKGGFILWDDAQLSNDAYIGKPSPSGFALDIFSNTINLRGSTLSLGVQQGNDANVCLDFDTTWPVPPSVDSQLCFRGLDERWIIGGTGFNFAVGFPTGSAVQEILFSTLFPSNNLSFNPIFGNNLILTAPDLKIDVPFVNFTGTANFSDACIDGGNCLSDFSTRQVFSAYDNIGGVTSASTTWLDMNFTTEKRKDSPYTHTSTNPNITIEVSGDYLVNYDLCFDISLGTTRTISQGRMVKNSVEIDGSLGFGYQRTLAQGENCFSASLIETFSSGDNLTIQFRRNSGASTIITIADSSRIFIDKI